MSFSVFLFPKQGFDFKKPPSNSTSLLYRGYMLGKQSTIFRYRKQVTMSKGLRGNLGLKCFQHIVGIDPNSNFHSKEVPIKIPTFLTLRSFGKSKNKMYKSGNSIFYNKYAFNIKIIGLTRLLFAILGFCSVLFCFLASLLCYKWLENDSYSHYLMTSLWSPLWRLYSIFSAKVKIWRR